MNRMAHGAHKSFWESNKKRKKKEVKLKWNQKLLHKVYLSIFWKCTKSSVDFGCQWNKINFGNPSRIFLSFKLRIKRILQLFVRRILGFFFKQETFYECYFTKKYSNV